MLSNGLLSFFRGFCFTGSHTLDVSYIVASPTGGSCPKSPTKIMFLPPKSL